MKKQSVIALSSSPRQQSNSDILADSILEGAGKAGAAVEKVRLHFLKIHPCTACNACQKSVDTPCVIKDDMAALLEKLRRADALVFASPIYFTAVNGQMKVFLDRLYALFGGGTFDALKGKRVGLALTYGDADPLKSGVMNAVRMFQDACDGLGWELAGWVHAACLKPGEIQQNEKILGMAKALGRQLANGG